MRLFIAVPLDDEVKNAICETIVSLKCKDRGDGFVFFCLILFDALYSALFPLF